MLYCSLSVCKKAMYLGDDCHSDGASWAQMLHLLTGSPTVPTTAVYKTPSGDARQWEKLSEDKKRKKQKQNKGLEIRRA